MFGSVQGCGCFGLSQPEFPSCVSPVAAPLPQVFKPSSSSSVQCGAPVLFGFGLYLYEIQPRGLDSFTCRDMENKRLTLPISVYQILVGVFNKTSNKRFLQPNPGDREAR